MLGLGTVVRDVERTLEPHRLVNYSYALASALTSFYDACAILKADPPVRASRLLLAQLTARTLAAFLFLGSRAAYKSLVRNILKLGHNY